MSEEVYSIELYTKCILSDLKVYIVKISRIKGHEFIQKLDPNFIYIIISDIGY